jgi:phage gp46-like protein
MSEQSILRARLSKVEALLARPGHEGERIAAQAAVERIGARLAELRRENPLPELLHPLSDVWADDLLAVLESQRVAVQTLCRSQMAMARGATAFINVVLWTRNEAIARFWYGGESGR